VQLIRIAHDINFSLLYTIQHLVRYIIIFLLHIDAYIIFYYSLVDLSSENDNTQLCTKWHHTHTVTHLTMTL